MTTDWDAYYRTVSARDPRTTLAAGLAAAGPARDRLAVDLGCGDGTDTLALLDSGWRVCAIDASPAFPGHLRERVPPGSADRVTIQVADFRDAQLPACHLVHAGFSLFFCPPDDVDRLWQRIRGAMLPGAVVSCHLLGPRDSWAGDPAISSHDRAGVERLLAGLQVEQLREEELDGWSYAGDKHWHLWHVVARAPG